MTSTFFEIQNSYSQYSTEILQNPYVVFPDRENASLLMYAFFRIAMLGTVSRSWEYTFLRFFSVSICF